MVIVAAVDQSDRAPLVAQEANSLADAFDDEVHLVHAVKRSEYLDSGFAGARTEGQVDMKEIKDDAADVADSVSTELDVPSESIGLVGKPAKIIVKYASENDARYIVVSPRKRSRAGKALFGSTAQSMLLNATCPVVSAVRN